MDGKKIFEGVKGYQPQYSSFDLSYEYKGSGDFGQLMPVFVQDVLPGDRFNVSTEVMVRFAPMVHPVLHRMDVYMHYFYVPNRIVWDDWEDFFTGGDDGTAAPTFPTFAGTDDADWLFGKLGDYMGVPHVPVITMSDPYDYISRIPFGAYLLIWNEYYRDQNLQTEIDVKAIVPVASTSNDEILTTLRERAWEKDYFTSALPDLQKGDAITAALTLSSNITYLNPATISGTASGASVDKAVGDPGDAQVGGTDVTITNISSLGLSGTVDVNDLRLANRLQEWWERRSRGGSRYTEVLKSEYNVNASDSRLQRPEYLGGGKQSVVVSEVLQTSEDGTTALGEMAGHGIAVGGDNKFSAFFEEHGYVIGIMSIMPRANYVNQGVPRHFFKNDKFDFGIPAFAHLGEQVVYNKELYIDPSTTGNDPEGTFGYQQRYAEYKHNKSMCVGEFGAQGSLKKWHVAREFPAEPSLDEDFILCEHDEDGIDRIFATQVTSNHKIWYQLYHKVHATRPLPYFSNPRL